MFEGKIQDKKKKKASLINPHYHLLLNQQPYQYVRVRVLIQAVAP